MRKSFTWFFSLLVLLTAFATHGYAQEAQETVELYAEEASDCYNEANDYTVTISVRDFIQLTSFELDLEFNDEVFSFDTESSVITELSGLNVSESGGVVTLSWSGSATTIGDNEQTDILDLHFSIPGYPGNTATSFVSDMTWEVAEFYYTDGSEEELVNTIETQDGSLSVLVGMMGIETSIESETCYGGEATITVTAPDADMYLFNEDGDDPDLWAWSDSPEYQAAAGESVTIRVKDANGCISLKKTVNIPQEVDPVSFTVQTQNPACYDGKGSVVINAVGGKSPYTYYINTSPSLTGATEKSNFQFSQEVGTYWVAVQDVNGCADLSDGSAMWKEITIEDNNPVVDGTISTEDVTCNGGSDGTITVAITEDGDPAGDNYQISLDGGNTWGEFGEYVFDDLPAADDYVLMARNTNGCEFGGDEVTVIDEPDAISFDMAVVDVSCDGNEDGEIAVTNIEGGTPPYTLSIEENGNVTEETGVDATGFTFTGLLPTYYSLTVTDANDCSVEYENPNNTQNVIAVQSPEDIQFEVNITDPDCYLEDAVVSIEEVTGGSGSYLYSFDGGSTWDDAMTYNWPAPYADITVSVMNAEGDACEVSKSYTSEDVGGPDAALTASVTDDFPPTCIDGTDGYVYVQVNGGTAPYSYSINGSSWKDSEDNTLIIRAMVGDYEIMVEDANGCEITEVLTGTITLEENVITASVSSVDPITCFGDKDGEIAVEFESWATETGDTGDSNLPDDNDSPDRAVQFFYYEIESEDGSSFNPSNHLEVDETATPFYAGTYVVWVEDQYGCISNTDTVEITENPELIIDDVIANGASCFGTYEGTITIHASGGNASEMNMLEYAVVNDEESLDNIQESKWREFEEYDAEDAISTVSFQVDGGTYWLAVRDDGCAEETYGPIIVDGYDELLVDEDYLDWEDPLCFEDSSGVVTVPMHAVSGGAGAYLFTLLDDSGEEVEGYVDWASGEFTGLPAGTYSVLVEDAEDCPSYTTAQVTLTDPPALDFNTDIKHFSCAASNDGEITVTIDDTDTGTPDYWYAINNSDNWIAFADDATSKTYIATEPGTFEIWVKDANGCVAGPKEVTILEPTVLSADITVDNNVSCYEGSDGQITVVGEGGWEDLAEALYEFKINDGDWTDATTISGLPAGDHTLYVRDVYDYEYNTIDYQNLDCVYEVPFTITEPGAITYTVDISDVKCKGGSDGTFTVEIISGGTPYDDDDTEEYGYNVRLTGDDYNSGWILTGEDNAYTFEDLAHSHYTLYIEDANSCGLAPTAGVSVGPYTTIESWEVQEPATELTLDPQWVKDASCYGEEDGQFIAHAMGGSEPYHYYAGLSVEPEGHVLVPDPDSDEWVPSDEFNVGAGTWVVWVMDDNGCIVGGETDDSGAPVNNWRVKIAQPDSIEWAFHTVGEEEEEEIHYKQPSCYGGWDGEIHLVDITGGSGLYNAIVSGTSAAGDDVDSTYVEIELDGSIYKLGGIPASDEDGYLVTVTDENGCESAVDTIVVDQPEMLEVELVKAEGYFECAGDVEGLIEAYATGGAGNYEYQLLKNGNVHTDWQSAGSAFLVETGNTFIVKVRDIGSECEPAEAELVLESPTPVSLDIVPLNCFGDVYASARIMATVDEGREFMVMYKEIVQGEGDETWTVYADDEGTEWFTEEVDMIDEFDFDGENLDDRHYAIKIEDEFGCASEIDTFTFDPVQTELTVSAMVEGNVITAQANGGAVDSEMNHHYEYALSVVDGDMIMPWQTENTFTIDAFNEYVVHARDHHLRCTATDTVIGGANVYTIAEVQGEADETAVAGEMVWVAGTVSGIVDGEGFFMQDDNAAWSGIWVEYADTDEVAVGDGVAVVGEVAEVDDVTTIIASVVNDETAPVEVAALLLDNPSDAQNEMYESVLVKVGGARAAAADENDRWEIYYELNDSVVVNKWLYTYVPTADHYYDVTGVVNGKNSAFMLEPRMEADVVDITDTTPVDIVPDDAIEFTVYPNPFSNEIRIDNNDKLSRVVISNIAGQRVLDVEYPDQVINTANLVSGVYVISLITEDGIVQSERIVKR